MGNDNNLKICPQIRAPVIQRNIVSMGIKYYLKIIELISYLKIFNNHHVFIKNKTCFL